MLRSRLRRRRVRILAITLVASVALLVGSEAGSAHADANFPFHGCPGSKWMSSAGSAWGTSDTSWTLTPGPPANFIVSMTPTGLARTAGIWADVWRDLTKCVKFPSNLPHSEIDSLQKQMDCHIFWSSGPFIKDGGKTWDFEGWRPDVSLAFVVSPAQLIDKSKHCNWGPPTGPPLPQQAQSPSTAPASSGGSSQLPGAVSVGTLPAPAPAPAPTTSAQPTWSEQETPNHPVNTFTDYHNASGLGIPISAGEWVQVSCKVYDPTIESVNPDGYWYRIASPPWNSAYYSPANTFMNGDPYGGPYTHNTDFAVADC
jgi:hypothetical protein